MTDNITLALTIDNIYVDGGEVTTTAVVHVPPPPPDEADAEDWADEHIYPLTGTGKTDGDAGYFVEVTKTSHPDLVPVGTTYEFGI